MHTHGIYLFFTTTPPREVMLAPQYVARILACKRKELGGPGAGDDQKWAPASSVIHAAWK